MRSLLLPLCLLALLPDLYAADEVKVDKRTLPIKVITLTRKDPVSYEKEIEPILVNKCNFCHSGNLKEGRLDLSSYETMMKGGKRGVPLVAGKAAESMIVKFCGKTEKPLMPPKSEDPLTPEELALLKLWIDQGARPPSGMREKQKIIVTAPPPEVHPTRGLAVSPDKSTVAASRGNQLHIYDAGSGAFVRTLLDPELKTADGKEYKAASMSLIESLAYSPDGKYIASGGFQEVVIWDAATGVPKHRIKGFAERVVALDFSPDSKMLATGGGGAATEDGEIKVYEVVSGKLVVEIKKDGHSDTVFGVSFSPDGKMLATCGADKFVKTYEMPSGNFLKSFEGHTHHVMDVGWQGDGKILASAGADNVVKIWDFEKGEQVRTINAHTKQVTRLRFIGKTDQFITCSGDQTARAWRTNGGNTGNLGGNTDFLYSIGVSTDGTVVAIGGEDGIVRLYKGTTGQPIKLLVPPGVELPKK